MIFATIISYFILSVYIQPNLSLTINRLDKHVCQVCSFTILLGLWIENNPFFYQEIMGYVLIFSSNLYIILELLLSLVGSLTF